MKAIKKSLSLLLAVILIFSLLSVSVYAEETENRIPLTTKEVQLVSHKGMCSLAPENTLPAFELSGKYGYYGIECDLQATKDGVWVISHDAAIDRLTDGRGVINELTYEEIIQYNVNYGEHFYDYINLKIARIEEVLDVCKKYSMKAYLELKDGSDYSNFNTLANIIKEKEMTSDVVLLSFFDEYLAYMQTLLPECEYQYLCYFITDDVIKTAVDNKFDALSFYYNMNGEEEISKAKYAGLGLCSWTVNDVETMENLYSLGITNITVDNLQPSQEGNSGEIVVIEEESARNFTFFKFVLGYLGWFISYLKSLIF